MDFRVRVARSVQRHIASWRLPDAALVEVHLRIQRLRQRPSTQLRRTRTFFDGMELAFSMIDPANRLHECSFSFHVRYEADETTLTVVRGICLQAFGY